MADRQVEGGDHVIAVLRPCGLGEQVRGGLNRYIITVQIAGQDRLIESHISRIRSQLALKQKKEENRKKEDKIRELQSFIERFSSNASKARQATSTPPVIICFCTPGEV